MMCMSCADVSLYRFLNSKLSIPDQSDAAIISVSGFLQGLKVDKMLQFTGHTDAYGEYGTRRVQNVTAVSMLHLTLTDMNPSPGQFAGEITHKLLDNMPGS